MINKEVKTSPQVSIVYDSGECLKFDVVESEFAYKENVSISMVLESEIYAKSISELIYEKVNHIKSIEFLCDNKRRFKREIELEERVMVNYNESSVSIIIMR